MMMSNEEEVEIYIEVLADYNEGHSYGEWINLSPDMDEDDIREAINEVLAKSPIAAKTGQPSKEYLVSYDGNCPDMGEYPGIDELANFCEAWDGYNGEIVKAIVEYFGTGYGFSILEDQSYSVYCSNDEVVDSWLEGITIPDQLERHIDRDSIFRMLETEGTFIEAGSGMLIEVYS